MTPEESRAETVEALAKQARAHQVWVWKMTLGGRHTVTELRDLGRKEGMKVTGMRRDELLQALAEVYATRGNEHNEEQK